MWGAAVVARAAPEFFSVEHCAPFFRRFPALDLDAPAHQFVDVLRHRLAMKTVGARGTPYSGWVLHERPDQARRLGCHRPENVRQSRVCERTRSWTFGCPWRSSRRFREQPKTTTARKRVWRSIFFRSGSASGATWVGTVTLDEVVRDLLRVEIRAVVREELALVRGPGVADAQTEFLTVKAAAKMTSVAVNTMRAWLREGGLKAYGAGRVLRIRRSELFEFLARPSAPAEMKIDEQAKRILARHG